MTSSCLVQRIMPPGGTQLLNMEWRAFDHASMTLRDLFKRQAAQQPGDLDFLMPFDRVASFADMRGRAGADAPPRIWRGSRQSEGYILINMGSDGSCLIAELLDIGGVPGATLPVRLHPHPLFLPLNKSLVVEGICFRLSAENKPGVSEIRVTPEPGASAVDAGSQQTPAAGQPLSSEEENLVTALLDREIGLWGHTFSVHHAMNQSPEAGWPAALCQHVFPDEGRATEVAEMLRAAGILAYDALARTRQNTLAMTVDLRDRPSPLAGPDERTWSVRSLLQNTLTPNIATAMVEQTLETALRTRWPEGWFDVAGPLAPRPYPARKLMQKVDVRVQGPISNHQKFEAMDRLGL